MTSGRSRHFAICLVTALAGLSALANCGCLLVAAGTAAGAVAGAAYVNGNVSATYFAYPNDVWMATRQGFTELGMPLNKESFDGFKGSLESTTSAGDKVSVTLECMSPPGLVDGAMTKLSIRIASFGDRNASERIFRQIGSHIPAPTLPAPANGGFAIQAGVGPIGTQIPSAAKPLTATNFVTASPESRALVIPTQEPPLASVPNQTQPPAAASGQTEAPSLAAPTASGAPKVPELPAAPIPSIQPHGTGA
jgi:hypothetical protein